MVCDDLDNGGAERQMTLLVRSLPDDYRARVFSLGDGPYAEVLRGLGADLRVDARRWRYDPSSALRLRREMVRWRPDVVHSWGWMSSAASILPCRQLGIPLVDGTIRSGRPPARWSRVNRFLVSRADAVIANSEAGVAAYGLLRPGVSVVHNGFEAERTPRESARPTRTQGAMAEVVMAARMVLAKDFDTLIDAVEALRHPERRMRFTLMGSGPERERLTTRCRELIGAGLVRIMDCGLEVMPVLAAADIGVLLTDPRYHAEGLSNSIMEYMACGLPVVCTDSGGNREIVLDGRTGLLVPPRDPAAVVDALRLLLEDPDTARRLGEAGEERIRAEFSTRAMVEKTISVYESVLRDGERTSSSPAQPREL
jgi:glycosyltransferase involved in cell wall biosynthesis